MKPATPQVIDRIEWTDDQVRVFIDIEKRLCAALGKPWKPTGMSTDTLIEDVTREIAKLRGELEELGKKS